MSLHHEILYNRVLDLGFQTLETISEDTSGCGNQAHAFECGCMCTHACAASPLASSVRPGPSPGGSHYSDEQSQGKFLEMGPWGLDACCKRGAEPGLLLSSGGGQRRPALPPGPPTMGFRHMFTGIFPFELPIDFFCPFFVSRVSVTYDCLTKAFILKSEPSSSSIFINCPSLCTL